jgi:hypothetical protein
MALRADSYLLNPGGYDAVDKEGRPTQEGAALLAELKNYAGVRRKIGTLRARTREYEEWWTAAAPLDQRQG